MIKKTITYDDMDDNPVTEDFWFHLHKDEVIDLEVKDKRGLLGVLQAIQTSEDSAAAWDWMKDLILLSYGERAPDNKGFTKTQALRDSFKGKAAFGDLLIELLGNEAEAEAFFNDLIPKKMQKELAEASEIIEPDAEKNTTGRPSTRDFQKKRLPAKEIQNVELPSGQKIPKSPNDMTREELIEAMRAKNG